MRTALDAPAEKLDNFERSFVAKVREHGWFHTQVVGVNGPGYSFTTGFWLNTGQPELVMFGMRRDIVHDVLWTLFRDAKAGVQLPLGKATDQVFLNLPAYAFPVSKHLYADYLGWSRWFYGGDDFPCLQMVWSDKQGLFPWEPGFDVSFESDQTDLTSHGWQSALTR